MKIYGFSLAEFVIVLLIIGILAVIAIPNYCDYRPVIVVLAGLDEAATVKQQVEKFHSENQRFPERGELSIDQQKVAQSKYLQAIDLLDKGAIQLTYDTSGMNLRSSSDLTGKTIVITPDYQNGRVEWEPCRNGTVPKRFRPAVCRLANGP